MSPDREVMTLQEAADFLRLSASTLYQRHDIPRHRLPGSRQVRFIRSELLAWLKGEQNNPGMKQEPIGGVEEVNTVVQPIVDISSPRLYHRNARFR